MNERIRDLAEHCDFYVGNEHSEKSHEENQRIWVEKFAELIIEECYQHCKDQLMDKKLAEEAGLDYNDGVMDCAIGLKQHFGVE